MSGFFGPIKTYGERRGPKADDVGRYRLRKGCARVALQVKRTGNGIGSGTMAEHFSNGYSESALEAMAGQVLPKASTLPSHIRIRNCDYIPSDQRDTHAA